LSLGFFLKVENLVLGNDEAVFSFEKLVLGDGVVKYP